MHMEDINNKEDINKKLLSLFPGKVVRKDLTKLIKEGANVPTYVLEYLLGMYCSSDVEETVKWGIEKVKGILSDNYVRTDEAEKIKSHIREKGRYKVIDKVTVHLNEKKDRYEAMLTNLGLKEIVTAPDYIKKFEKLLAGGIWCILTIEYFYDESAKDSPFVLRELKPIQMPNMEMNELFTGRKSFNTQEWINIILRSVGMEPANLDEKSRWHLIARLIPFVENNYNMCELGPRGTGKSYVYKEMSPNSILVSGGQTTVANLFYNMATRRVGLVGLWDIVAFDEVAGINFKDKGGVQIMKDYMASGSFARGKDPVEANAAMVFIGNINEPIEHLLKTSHLLSPFPDEMIDTAFFDRFHTYLPGWEVPKMRPEFFTDQFGFITDYLAEWFREMRKKNFADAINKYYRLGNNLNQRDVIAVKKTVSGLLKILYPHGEFTKEELQTCLEYALTGRRRIKEQLKKIGGMEFYDVHFSYIDPEKEEEKFITLPEVGGRNLIPEGRQNPGIVYVIAKSIETGHKGLYKLEIQTMSGSGKFSHTGFGSKKITGDELKEGENYFKANLTRISGESKYTETDFHMKAVDLNGIGEAKEIELAVFLSLVSGITRKSIQPQTVVIGSMSIGGTIIKTDSLADALQIAVDSGAKKVLIPVSNMVELVTVPPELFTKLQLIHYNDPADAAFKALGVE